MATCTHSWNETNDRLNLEMGGKWKCLECGAVVELGDTPVDPADVDSEPKKPLAQRLITKAGGSLGKAAALAARRRDKLRHSAERARAHGNLMYHAAVLDRSADQAETARVEIEREHYRRLKGAA